MTSDQALEYQKRGGKLYEPIRFDPALRCSGPLYIVHIPALAQGGPGDDSHEIHIPPHHVRSK